MSTTTNCILCGLPVTDDAPGVVVPKAKMHYHCHSQDGRHPDDIADALPCCDARHILSQLCGSIVQIQEKIPSNQMWVYNRKEKKVYRYLFYSSGPILLELLSEQEAK